MRTAVQIRTSTSLICTAQEAPDEIQEGKNGPIWIYESSRIVVYTILQKQRFTSRQSFVFRTGAGGTASLPGVFPDVHLLIYARGRNQVSRLHQALGLAKQTYWNHLLDDFFVRLAAIINKKDLRFGEIERLVSRSIASSKRRNNVNQ